MDELKTILRMIVVQHFKNFILPEWILLSNEISQGVQMIFLITYNWFWVGVRPLMQREIFFVAIIVLSVNFEYLFVKKLVIC